MFIDNWLDEETKFFQIKVRIPRRCAMIQIDFSEDIGLSLVLDKKMSGLTRTLTNRKDNGRNMSILWSNTLKKVDTWYSEISVRSTEES